MHLTKKYYAAGGRVVCKNCAFTYIYMVNRSFLVIIFKKLLEPINIII